MATTGTSRNFTFPDKFRLSDSFFLRFTLIAMLLGVLLRLRQYLFNRSLWLDEAMLGNNVVERGFHQLLFEPLTANQSAPPGFLLAARATAEWFGPYDWALRIFPLVAGILSILLAFLLARRELRSSVGRAAFVAFVALSPLLIFYSSEFKQYSSDAFFTLCIVTAFSYRSSRYGTWVLAAAGFAALVCSLPAVFVAAAAGLLLLYEAVRSSRWRQTIIVGLVWAAGAALHGLYVLHAGVDRPFMISWWGGRNGFAPVFIDSWRDLLWYPRSIARLVYQAFVAAYPISPTGSSGWRPDPLQLFFLTAFILSVIAAVRTRRDVFILAAGAIVLTLAASALQIYPFSSRLLLFLVPLVLLLLAAGIEDLDRRYGPAAAGALLILLLAMPAARAVQVAWQPWVASDMRGALGEIAKRFEAGDAVVAGQNNDLLVRFYRDRLPANAPVFTIGSGNDAALIPALVEKHGFRRVWFVAAHRAPQGKLVIDETLRTVPAAFIWDRRNTHLVLFDFSGSAAGSPR